MQVPGYISMACIAPSLSCSVRNFIVTPVDTKYHDENRARQKHSPPWVRCLAETSRPNRI